MSILERLPTSIEQYPKLLRGLKKCSEEDQRSHLRNLCLTDLYFLLRYGCARKDLEDPWLFARCREVQAEPDGRLDLWARFHYKSSIGTFGLTLQDILKNPEETVGIFSHTRPIAKGFLRQLKYELERNERLKGWFDDVLWADPQKEAPKWSEDDGIVVKRKGNPKESTVEAWGVVDGQPTSKHFSKLVYDDVVTKESVTSPDMIQKTTDSLALSYNLGMPGGKRRFYGTRYHYNDTYKAVIDRGTAKPRVHTATVDGEPDGTPVLITAEYLAELRRDMGPYIFGAQMLQDPASDSVQGFKREWLRYWRREPDGNKYLLVDAASEKKKGSDYTCMVVLALGSDRNIYILDMVRDRLNLTQRADRVMRLHRKWRPYETRYERYGMMADIEHIKTRQELENYRFDIVEVGGATPKNDRIRRLIPFFEQARVYLPETLYVTDYEGIARDLVTSFVEEEYAAFPVSLHDDMLDALARIAEQDGKNNGDTIKLELSWPMPEIDPDKPKDKYAMNKRMSVGAWGA